MICATRMLNGIKCGMAKIKISDDDDELEEELAAPITVLSMLPNAHGDEILTYFKPRRTDLLGPLNSDSCKPIMITGWAGSGKTTALSNLVMDGGLSNTVFCSPTQQLRVVAALGFPQTMCHPRITGKAPPKTEKGVDLEKYNPAVIFVDEATMLLQADRCSIEKTAKKWGSKLIYMGHYSENTGTPMQIGPIGSASMNTERMQKYHVTGVKRTNEPALVELC